LLCAAAGCCYCVYAAVCCSKGVVVDVDVVDVVVVCCSLLMKLSYTALRGVRLKDRNENSTALHYRTRTQ
jgi:hypothetical protein